MYLIFKLIYLNLIFIYSLCSAVELLPEECIADYLLLSRNIKTEGFATIIQTKDMINTVEIMRGIPKDEALQYPRIYTQNIANFMGKEYARNCVKKNKNFKVNSQYGLKLDIEKLFSQSEGKTHLILSKNIRDLLDKQETCLNNFLNEYSDKKYTILKSVPQISNDQVENFDIINKFKIKSKEYICHWDLESSGILARRYFKDSAEYNKLDECNKILTYYTKRNMFSSKKKKHQDDCYKTLVGSKYIILERIFNHFNLNQFYLKEISYVKNIKVESTPECPICLTKINVGDTAQQLIPCNHIFHKECIQPWFRSNPHCPVCRKFIMENEAD